MHVVSFYAINMSDDENALEIFEFIKITLKRR